MAKYALKKDCVDTAHLLQRFVVLFHVGNSRDIIHTVDREEPEKKVKLSIGKGRAGEVHEYIQCTCLFAMSEICHRKKMKDLQSCQAMETTLEQCLDQLHSCVDVLLQKTRLELRPLKNLNQID